MTDIISTAASSVTRTGSCRKNKGVKNTVQKRSMKTKTVSHLQKEIANNLGYKQLSEPLIESLKTALEKNKYTGFAVLFFEGKQTSTMRDVIQLLHSRWDNVLEHAHQSIPDETKCFSTCIVTPYYNNETEQMHLYFMYSDLSYEALSNRLSSVVDRLISK